MMKEGWFNEDYWALCEDQGEAEQITGLYGITQYLPGHFIVGLKGWDHFILCDQAGQYFTVPTVPLDRERLSAFQFPSGTLHLESAADLTGKIKWYVKPLAFGGDPTAHDNIRWLSMREHVEVVKWWNQLYYDTFKKK